MRANVPASAIFTLEAEREQEMGQPLLTAFRSSQIIFVFTLKFWTESVFKRVSPPAVKYYLKFIGSSLLHYSESIVKVL